MTLQPPGTEAMPETLEARDERGEFRVVTLQLGFDFAEALLLVVIQ